ncbi:hypothetical protein EC973_001066 [Apophysomyces ossiformis]|uniref:SEC7 domain-containing protein n=1 Tax=Apophysomyces ossiformis TaxID=679940 RepID=A0A8H7EU22_9FUNG|nr:hypothetical protein EC973_001066 [Apophysomyces ossiformis]
MSTRASRSSTTMSSVYTTFASPDEENFSQLVCKRHLALDTDNMPSYEKTADYAQDNEDSSSEEFVDAVDNQASESTLEGHSCKDLQEPDEPVQNVQRRSILTDTESIAKAVDRLWKEDPSFCSKESIAEWLGTRAAVLQQYMDCFEFSKQRVDMAFRKLCSKLYLKAESQQIDRILEAFASRYWECNSDSVLGSKGNKDKRVRHNSMINNRLRPDVVYAVAYSILLLNTDLHAAKINHRKMTRSKFVKNTIATIRSLNSAPCSADTPFNLPNTSHFSVSLPVSTSVRSALSSASSMPSSFRAIRRNPSVKSLSCIQHKKSSDTLRIAPAISMESLRSKNFADQRLFRKQKAWLTEMEALLKDIYNRTKSNPINQASTAYERQPSATEELQKQDSASPSVDDISADVSINVHKEGFVMRKQVLESSDRKAKSRGWQLCYMEINEGEITMYRPTNGSSKDNRRSLVIWSHNKICNMQENLNSLPSVSNDDCNSDKLWKHGHHQVLGKIDTKHSLARLLPPPGWNGQRHHVFCLETADGAVWLFEALNLYSVLEWVSTCNYWAALKSKEPLPGGVCNLDYGWGTAWTKQDLQEDGVTLSRAESPLPEWKPPAPCLVSSTLSECDQLQSLTRCADGLVNTLEEHRGLKELIERKVSHNQCVAPSSHRSLVCLPFLQ